MRNTLIVFTKAPQICRVKTRLWPALSHRECLYLHRKLIQNIINSIKCNTKIEVKFYATNKNYSYMNNTITYEQVGNDLGARMLHAIQQESKHSNKTVLIGSDCLEFSSNYIKNAFQALKNRNDIVIGPTNDGGYALIGMRKPHPALFKNIPWSTPEVISKTIDVIQKERKKYTLLPEVIDIDDYNDLVKIHQKGLLPQWAQPMIKI